MNGDKAKFRKTSENVEECLVASSQSSIWASFSP